MSLSVRQLIALNYIPNCAKKSLRILADSAKDLNLDNENLLLGFVNNSINKKVIKKVSTHVLIEDLHSYLESADEILLQSKALGIKAISFQDEDYPKQLLSTLDEKGNLDIPVILYYKGNIELAKKPGIAIIGTREPTKEGILASQYFAKQFAEVGYNIISGLALGCDTYAHRGALSVPNGKTTAFLANGLDSVYPALNKNLFEEILDKEGLIVSHGWSSRTRVRVPYITRFNTKKNIVDSMNQLEQMGFTDVETFPYYYTENYHVPRQNHL